MPVYEYMCDACGPFTAIRPVAEFDRPTPCPICEAKAPRVLLTAPNFASMDLRRRAAIGVNERSANAPTTLSERRSKHGAGCSCCGNKTMRYVKRGKDGTKSFPTARPWMISH
jgi:putative FmdB family regulatory protein